MSISCSYMISAYMISRAITPANSLKDTCPSYVVPSSAKRDSMSSSDGAIPYNIHRKSHIHNTRKDGAGGGVGGKYQVRKTMQNVNPSTSLHTHYVRAPNTRHIDRQ